MKGILVTVAGTSLFLALMKRRAPALERAVGTYAMARLTPSDDDGQPLHTCPTVLPFPSTTSPSTTICICTSQKDRGNHYKKKNSSQSITSICFNSLYKRHLFLRFKITKYIHTRIFNDRGRTYVFFVVAVHQGSRWVHVISKLSQLWKYVATFHVKVKTNSAHESILHQIIWK